MVGQFILHDFRHVAELTEQMAECSRVRIPGIAQVATTVTFESEHQNVRNVAGVREAVLEPVIPLNQPGSISRRFGDKCQLVRIPRDFITHDFCVHAFAEQRIAQKQNAKPTLGVRTVEGRCDGRKRANCFQVFGQTWLGHANFNLNHKQNYQYESDDGHFRSPSGS